MLNAEVFLLPDLCETGVPVRDARRDIGGVRGALIALRLLSCLNLYMPDLAPSVYSMARSDLQDTGFSRMEELTDFVGRCLALLRSSRGGGDEETDAQWVISRPSSKTLSPASLEAVLNLALASRDARFTSNLCRLFSVVLRCCCQDRCECM
jgi:hypothetical protein